jgi:Stigma-specific protein, Stig1
VVGKCVCPTGKTLCGKTCVDTKSDDSNCGVCGNTCGSGKSCCSGSCVSCPLGGDCLPTTPPVCVCPADSPTICLTVERQPACVNLKKDSLACGRCGHRCRVGEDPEHTETCCNGACVNTQKSLANCGACGSLCSTGPGGKAACCNGGCTNTNSDPKNCGGCGIGCPKFFGCVSGRCRAPCGPGQRCDTGKCDCPRGFGCEFGTCRRVQP